MTQPPPKTTGTPIRIGMSKGMVFLLRLLKSKRYVNADPRVLVPCSRVWFLCPYSV